MFRFSITVITAPPANAESDSWLDYNAFDDQETSADSNLAISSSAIAVADAGTDVTESLLDFDTMEEGEGEKFEAVEPVGEQEADVEPEAEAEEAEAQMTANVSMRGRSSSKANKKVSMSL